MHAAHTTIDYIAAYATAATAIGTIGLAIATFVLALKTRALAKSGQQTANAAAKELTLLTSQTQAMTAQSEASAKQVELLARQTEEAKRQSEAAEGALSASVRPLLVDVPRYTMRPVPIDVTWTPGEAPPRSTRDVDVSHIEWDANAEEVWLKVPVRNVGAGIALGQAAALTIAAKDALGQPLVRGVAPPVIAAGEHAYVVFGANSEADDQRLLLHLLNSEEELVLEVAYCDLAERQQAATALYLAMSGRTKQYVVKSVFPGRTRWLTAS